MLTTRICRDSAFRPLAVSIAATLLMATALPTRSQTTYYQYSGSVSNIPPNVNDPVFDIGTIDLSVGNSVPGSFSALAGATLTAGALTIANGGVFPANSSTGSYGDVTLSGLNPSTLAPTTVLLGGTGNRLQVGNWGEGSLTVSGGALLDATVNAAACSTSGALCNNFIGNGAGSTGTLTITGAGSEVRTLRNFTVGQTAVFTTAGSGFGTPGGTTNATVNVLDGGTLRTETTRVGFNFAAPNGQGDEKANGTVVVSGTGSQWLLTHNSIDNQPAVLLIGLNTGGTGAVTVSNGGKLLVDGRAGPGPNDLLHIGVNGGKGTLTVTGVGSSVDVIGFNTLLQVGRSGAGAEGSFNVLAGATASAMYTHIGRDGATGTMVIDGVGSELNQVGVNSNPSPNNGPAFSNIGRDGGNGAVTVKNGGKWLISDGGADARASGDSPGFIVGRGANSTGSVLITGQGSTVEVKANSINPQGGAGDNYNPFAAIGYDSPGTSSGTLVVEAGGKLIMTGNAVSTASDPRATQLAIGGRNGVAGAGTATVTGTGSEIIVQGQDALITVGRTAGGSGTLNVLDGGKVSGTLMLVGTETTGTVNIDNSRVELAGRFNQTGTGAALGVGRGGGVGFLNMTNGATLAINPDTFVGGGLGIGGTSFAPGGTGTVSLSGGSAISVGGSVAANVAVGRDGTGTLNLAGASSLSLANGSVYVGQQAGGVGRLDMSGGSVVSAGFVGVGVGAAGTGNAIGTAGGTGTLVLNNSTINTSRFELGAGSLLTGDGGVINAGTDGPVVIAGTIMPGNSPGRLRFNCDVTMLFGSQLILEINDTGVGFEIDQLIIGNDSTFDLTQLQIIFSFIGGTNPNDYVIDLDNFLKVGNGADETAGLSTLFQANGNDYANWGQAVDSNLFGFRSTAYDVTSFSFNAETGQVSVAAAAVPEPTTIALVLLALAAMLLAARQSASRRAF